MLSYLYIYIYIVVRQPAHVRSPTSIVAVSSYEVCRTPIIPKQVRLMSLACLRVRGQVCGQKQLSPDPAMSLLVWLRLIPLWQATVVPAIPRASQTWDYRAATSTLTWSGSREGHARCHSRLCSGLGLPRFSQGKLLSRLLEVASALYI